MNRPFFLLAFALAATLLLVQPSPVRGQSAPTASRSVEPSAFLGLTGAYTGLESSRNLSLTAGLDVGFRPFFGFMPSVEVRGTYPMGSGRIVSEKDVLAGLRLQQRYGGFRPYIDFLVGRGQLDYQNGGFIVPAQSFRYLESTTNVFSPGIGFELDVRDNWAVLVDGQLQHWAIPFSPNPNDAGAGHLYAKVGTVGVVYRFSWLRHGHPGP